MLPRSKHGGKDDAASGAERARSGSELNFTLGAAYGFEYREGKTSERLAVAHLLPHGHLFFCSYIKVLYFFLHFFVCRTSSHNIIIARCIRPELMPSTA